MVRTAHPFAVKKGAASVKEITTPISSDSSTQSTTTSARPAPGPVVNQQPSNPSAKSGMKPPTFMKREAEGPLENIANKPEAPLLRRSKIFQSLAGVPAKLELKPIASPDELTDYELKECYDIVKAAMSFTFEHRSVSPALMEDFLKDVFQDWTALDEPPIQRDLSPFPYERTDFQLKDVIGTMTLGRETVNIQHWLTLTTEDEVSLKIEVVRPTKTTARTRQTISPEELRRIKWSPASDILASKANLQKHALNFIVNKLAVYNRERAIAYARAMLHHQTLGTAAPAPCSGRYEFASLHLAINSLPLLDVSDLEQGNTTVVMFSTVELGSTSFEGSNAIRGKKVLKTSTC